MEKWHLALMVRTYQVKNGPRSTLLLIEEVCGPRGPSDLSQGFILIIKCGHEHAFYHGLAQVLTCRDSQSKCIGRFECRCPPIMDRHHAPETGET